MAGSQVKTQEKVYVPHFLGKNAKRDPHKLFRGNFPGSHKPVSLNGCLRGAWRGVGRKGWQRAGQRLAKG